MRQTTNTLGVTALAMGFVLAGCVLNSPPPRNSRHSVDITSMEKSALRKDTWVFRHPTKHVTDYIAFNIPQITVYEHSADKINPEFQATFDALGQKLRGQTIDLLKVDYPIIGQDGEGVLRLEISIMDIKPIVHLKNSTGNMVTIFDHSKIGTKLEMDCRDSVTDELIFAVSSLYSGPEYAAYKDPALLKNVETVYADWSAFFKSRLDDARTQK